MTHARLDAESMVGSDFTQATLEADMRTVFPNDARLSFGHEDPATEAGRRLGTVVSLAMRWKLARPRTKLQPRPRDVLLCAMPAFPHRPV